MGTIAQGRNRSGHGGSCLSLPARKAAEILLVQLHRRETSAIIISTIKEDEAFIRFDFGTSSYVVVVWGVTVLVAFR
jgi:hypothetical protein